MNWYLDASVLVPLHISEPSTEAVHAAFAANQTELMVSTLAAGEFASAISRRVRMKAADSDTALAWLDLFDEWSITDTQSIKVEDRDIARAAALVRRFDLKLLMPDAIHLALCIRHDLVMVTLDERFAEAATALGIGTIVPD